MVRAGRGTGVEEPTGRPARASCELQLSRLLTHFTLRTSITPASQASARQDLDVGVGHRGATPFWEPAVPGRLFRAETCMFSVRARSALPKLEQALMCSHQVHRAFTGTTQLGFTDSLESCL